MKMRHEYKHSINYEDYLLLKQRLNALFRHDDHVDAKGEYIVRSLYFDNWRDKALLEKRDGIKVREKFRIRCYNYDFSFIRLEKKMKIDRLCNKRSTPLSREQAAAILRGETAWMPGSKNPLLIELYSKMKAQVLRPGTIVDYIREPFVYPPGNVRITLDRDIRTGLNSRDFFDPELPTVETGLTPAILEVKYDAFLPDIVRDAIQLRNRRHGAFSKYAAGRRYC